jgi:predicted transcriptional regulator
MQKSMIALQELKEATAAEVAGKTSRNRSVETIYLNGLARMGLVSRERRGHRVYFRPIRYY